MFKCPYCQQDSYNKNNSKKRGKFESWLAVRNHTRNCSSNNKLYVIDEVIGPIHFDTIYGINYFQAQKLGITLRLHSIKRTFKERGINTGNHNIIYTKEFLIQQIKDFYKNNNNKIPQERDFINNNKYPCHTTYQNHFGSWNDAIKAAGFEPNLNAYGIPTKAIDNIIYRSKAEAYFVDNYLYNKYKYVYEPKYENYNKYYDFYLPELNLYIEIDGQLRPEVIQEKIQINKQEQKNLLVINTSEIYSKKELKDFMVA